VSFGHDGLRAFRPESVGSFIPFLSDNVIQAARMQDVFSAVELLLWLGCWQMATASQVCRMTASELLSALGKPGSARMPDHLTALADILSIAQATRIRQVHLLPGSWRLVTITEEPAVRVSSFSSDLVVLEPSQLLLDLLCTLMSA
jgi:hypothetical protein